MTKEADILVMGLGGPDRGDDAVGPAVARVVAQRLADVDVVSGPRDAAWILDAWRGRVGVVVVDAVRSGRPVGTVDRLDPRHGPYVDSAASSTHGLGLASAIELGRALGDLPLRLALIGVEGATFGLGAWMSDEVRSAVPEAAERVIELVGGWRRESREAEPHA